MYNGKKNNFDNIRESYLEWYFSSNPVSATWIGIHTYDGRLPSNTPNDYVTSKTITKSFLNQLEQINSEILTKNDKVDLDLMKHSLEKS